MSRGQGYENKCCVQRNKPHRGTDDVRIQTDSHKAAMFLSNHIYSHVSYGNDHEKPENHEIHIFEPKLLLREGVRKENMF